MDKVEITNWVRKFKERKKLSDHRVSVEMGCIVSANTINKLLSCDKYISDKSFEKIGKWIENYEQVV